MPRTLSSVWINFHVITDYGVFRDNAELDSDELFLYLSDASHTASSQVPDTDRFERFFSTMLTRAQHVIHISIISGNSNAYANASMAAASFDNVNVIDSGQISSGTGLVALYAARMAETDMPVERILEEIEHMKRQVKTSFIVDNTSFLRKGGRVSGFVDAVSRALLFHPVISLDNARMQTKTVLPGDHKVYRAKYIRMALRNKRKIDTSILFLTYVGIPEEELSDIKEQVERVLHFDKIIVQKASSTTAVNCGPGTFGLIYRVYGSEPQWKQKLFDFLPASDMV